MFTTSCFRERLYRKHLAKKFRINVNMANFIVNKCPYPMPFFFSTPAVILQGSWENSAKLKKNKKNVSEFIYMGKRHYNWLVKIQILRGNWRAGFFIWHRHETAKKHCFLNGFLSRCWEKKSTLTWQSGAPNENIAQNHINISLLNIL